MVIKIGKANNLQAYDIGGKSDPYVELVCGERKRVCDYLKSRPEGKSPGAYKLDSATTSVKTKSLSPDWEHETHTLLMKAALPDCVVVVCPRQPPLLYPARHPAGTASSSCRLRREYRTCSCRCTTRTSWAPTSSWD